GFLLQKNIGRFLPLRVYPKYLSPSMLSSVGFSVTSTGGANSAIEWKENMTERNKKPEKTQKANVLDQINNNYTRNFLKAGSVLGLAAGFIPVAIAEAFTDSKFSAAETHELITDKEAIRPFKVNFSDPELAELRKRVNATKWPERETVSDQSQGVQL